jgi:diguanylate cyclase (GGDEF)-like protein
VGGWLGKAESALAGVPDVLIFGLGVVAMAGVAVLDVAAKGQLSFSLLYLGPIALVTWFTRRTLGYLMAVGGAAMWFVADRVGQLAYQHSTAPLLNAGLRLGFFVIATAVVLAFRDALQQEQLLARTDSLTGVANTRSFIEATRMELYRARRYNRPLSIVYVDLDDFKRVNDRLGHSGGDAVLRMVAQEVGRCLRAPDVIGRLGGDEFALLLPETDGEAAKAVVRNMRDRLRAAMMGSPMPVTLSIGAVTYARPPETPDELIGSADRLMYQVKAGGKDEAAYRVA